MAEDWEKGGAGTFRWCKGMSDEAAVLLQRPDGSLTANAQEADELLRAARLPIFQSYWTEQPSWEEFQHHFGEYITITPGSEMRLEDITGDMLKITLSKMANKSAAGADGW